MAKTVHFLYGCPWADGTIQLSDTIQTCDWKKVTCNACSLNYTPGKNRRAERHDWDAEKDQVRPGFEKFFK